MHKKRKAVTLQGSGAHPERISLFLTYVKQRS